MTDSIYPQQRKNIIERKRDSRMKQNFKRIIALVLTFVISMSLAACGGGGEDGGGGQAKPPEETANTNNSGEPVYGGTFACGKASSCMGLCNLYSNNLAEQYAFPAVESLGRWNFDTQEYDPFLLEDWEHDYEANTFTMHLREGVMFHDGTPFDAEALKWNLETFVENRGASGLGNPTGFEVVDETTLVATFESPSFAWESQFAQIYIYSPKSIQDNGEDWAQTHVVGTGPFVFESYTPDQSIVYKRNEGYWQEGKPYLDEYIVRIITDWAALEAAFINGDVNYYACADTTTCQELINLGYTSKAVDVPENYITFTVMLNNTAPDDPFSDIRVRQAVLYYGVDWNGIGIACRGQFAQGLGQFLTPGSWGYMDDYWLDENTLDRDKAKELLAEAGYADGFETTIHATVTYQQMATALQSELEKIGIKAEVNICENSAAEYADPTLTGIHMGAWFGATDSANTLAKSFHPDYYKIIDYSDEYLEQVNKSATALTQEERAESQGEALRILYEDMCVARAYFTQQNFTVLTEGAMDVGAEYKTYYSENIWWSN